MDDSLPQLDQRISQYYERTPEDDVVLLLGPLYHLTVVRLRC
jgi:hypothetical protein